MDFKCQIFATGRGATAAYPPFEVSTSLRLGGDVVSQPHEKPRPPEIEALSASAPSWKRCGWREKAIFWLELSSGRRDDAQVR
jgi:hypothetical protein